MLKILKNSLEPPAMMAGRQLQAAACGDRATACPVTPFSPGRINCLVGKRLLAGLISHGVSGLSLLASLVCRPHDVSMDMTVVFVVRTGRRGHLSTAGFTGVPTAILPQDNAPPEVPREFLELDGPWHRLVHVGQEVGKGWTSHRNSLRRSQRAAEGMGICWVAS